MHQRYALLNVDLPLEKLRQQKIRMAMRAAGWIFGLAAVFLGVWYGVSWVMKAGFSQNEANKIFGIQKGEFIKKYRCDIRSPLETRKIFIKRHKKLLDKMG